MNTDKTYAKIHRDLMNYELEKQDKEWAKKNPPTVWDRAFLFGVAVLVSLATLWLCAALVYRMTR